MTTHRTHILVALAAALAVTATAVAAPASGATPSSRLAPTCLRTASRTSACQLVADYFTAANSGHTAEACALLGHKLLSQTNGASCPYLLGANGPIPFRILGARSARTGVEVLVAVGLHEFDHWRMLDWVALVGREGGQLRILKTLRV